MEQQIQDLISSIKKDGVEAAEKEKKRIIDDAKLQASSIIKKAEEDARKMKADALKEIELEKSSAEASIKQAGRDVSLSLKKSIENEFSNILKSSLEEALHGDVLVKVLEGVLKADSENKDVYCYLSESDFKALEGTLATAFKKEIENGLEFKTSSSISSGLRIELKDGSAYIDLGSEECTALLFPYISSELKEIL